MPSSPASSPSAQGPLPTASAASSQEACTKTLGTFCHIETRTDDPTPLTTAQLYPVEFTANETDKISYSLVSTKADTTCSSAVIGANLISVRADAVSSMAQAAEQLGYESVFVPDHLVFPETVTSRYPFSPDGVFTFPTNIPLIDPWVLLSHVAAPGESPTRSTATTRCRALRRFCTTCRPMSPRPQTIVCRTLCRAIAVRRFFRTPIRKSCAAENNAMPGTANWATISCHGALPGWYRSYRRMSPTELNRQRTGSSFGSARNSTY